MLEYIFNILSKPVYQQTPLDKLALLVIVLVSIALILVVFVGILYLIGIYCENKRKKCKACDYTKSFCRDASCIGCTFYKKTNREK